LRIVWWIGGIVILALAGWLLFKPGDDAGPGGRVAAPAAVEVGPIRRETIELRRVFTGTLESPAQFVVAPKVGGRVAHLAVDLGDRVQNGQILAELDDEEFEQAVVQAEAELEVARANLVEAKSNLEIAEREMSRTNSLQSRGIATDSQVDVAKAQLLTREAAVEVAKAQVTRAEAALAGARIRLGYSTVAANWVGNGRRFVARRFINEGETIAANTPLLSIVELDPIIAVVYITEKDYGLLQVGQPATITTDAFPGATFRGEVARVAPAFNQSSRQARIELMIANPDQQLKPGMVVQAEVLLDQSNNAATVPLAALVERGGQTGVFVVNQAGDRVAFQPVTPGIRQGERVEAVGADITGFVVTVGQQLIDDGSPVTIPRLENTPEREQERRSE